MNTTARYFVLVLGVILSIHFVLSFTHQEYGRATSLSSIASHFSGNGDLQVVPDPYEGYVRPTTTPNATHFISDKRANATFVILARNTDIDGTVRSIREMEDRFNKYYKYPYVLLNEVPFTEDFKRRVSVLTDAHIDFGTISHDDWFQPAWIDEQKAKEGREKLVADKVIYGGSVSYRNMCRFNSGFFFKQPLMEKYRWYWRIEPDVHFHCDLNFDPFLYMEENNKVYGFTITMYEFEKTIPTLWASVKEFIKLHPEFVSPDNAMAFMSENGGDSYNLCHFWSNFEIADMNFWRGPAYTAFFDFLDQKGGFYYERWGDAPVHSIAAALFNRKDQIHFFDVVGYEHNPYVHCPRDDQQWKAGRCTCDQKRSFDYDGYSCMSKWDRLIGR
ncbi:glycosyltransferase family 15 protein [Pluteus cervinus]|uniref:Glycosyltransferase family 15 protein n=1 Tax=Pluteus cervinus TaxID=181527 RepID=A0ACD3B1D5_9AGAR|nr:glycosyltransferase family 15 protein [Pluteus cervinus]